jgi:cytochrome b subunit of formate dehydrogenase
VSSAPPPETCADCHDGQVDDDWLGPPHVLLEESVHADEDCDSCHADIDMDDLDLEAENPHPDEAEPVGCGDCHEDEAEVYRKHGRLEIGEDPDLPNCWDCHGSHDILPSSDRHARTHPINLPKTCRTCHLDVDLVKKHDTLRDKQVDLYQSSVHGKPTEKGVYVAASCSDCHAVENEDGEKDAHRILGPDDPESTIFHFTIPQTCAQCHDSVSRDYAEGIHGQLVARGDAESPVCTHCHGEHGIISPSDPRSPVSAGRVAEATCSPCHESELLNEKYGVIAGRLRSYIDSYHGLKSKAGDVRVANCSSCHGAHRILPHTDETSSIHPDNLKDTCGECHPGISADLAATAIHEANGKKGGWPHFFTILYLWLISLTIGGMVLHNSADFLRYVRNIRNKPYVIRLSLNETTQHWALAISFIVLVISGFSLRFGEAWWVLMLFGWGEGEGFLIRGTVHRTAGVIFMLCAVWHVIFLFGHRGRRLLRDMLPDLRDLSDVKDNLQYFLGRREHGASFRRFSYIEKAEYWALMWGGMVMSVTGIVLWLDNYFVTSWGLPKGVLDVLLVVHYYEAWLALLAIIVWHGYSVIFNPHVYPMNPAWVSGKMPREMYLHEHPEAPRLKARSFRRVRHYVEEELEDDLTEPAGAGASPAADEEEEEEDDPRPDP